MPTTSLLLLLIYQSFSAREELFDERLIFGRHSLFYFFPVIFWQGCRPWLVLEVSERHCKISFKSVALQYDHEFRELIRFGTGTVLYIIYNT